MPVSFPAQIIYRIVSYLQQITHVMVKGRKSGFFPSICAVLVHINSPQHKQFVTRESFLPYSSYNFTQA